MTWAELERLLPNGFHDARLDGIAIDYRRRTATFVLELWTVEEWPEPPDANIPNLYRRGRLTLSGLLACAVDVPNGEYQVPDACALWIDVAPVKQDAPEQLLWPNPSWPDEPLPDGAFVRSFYFLNDSASFIHVAAQGVDFAWLTETRLLDEVADE